MPRTTSSEPGSRLAGGAIRAARTERDLTQAQLAERLEVTPAYIQKLEGGRANPTVGQLTALGEALGMRLVLGFELEPEPIDPFADLAQI